MKHGGELEQRQQALDAAQAANVSLQDELGQTHADLAEEQANHRRTTERLQQEQLALARARQQVTDLDRWKRKHTVEP